MHLAGEFPRILKKPYGTSSFGAVQPFPTSPADFEPRRGGLATFAYVAVEWLQKTGKMEINVLVISLLHASFPPGMIPAMLHNPWPEVLTNLRKRKRIKQVTAALQGKVDLSTWNGWERGRHQPSLDYLEKIRAGIGCTWEDLGREVADAYERHYYADRSAAGAASVVASPFQQIEKLKEIDLEQLPDDLRSALRQQRDIITVLIALYEPLINVYKETHHALSKRLQE